MDLRAAAEAAFAAAACEGLTLVRSDNATGFKGVYHRKASKSKPFQAQLRRVGKLESLGYHATAEEAAQREAARPGLLLPPPRRPTYKLDPGARAATRPSA